MAMDEQTKRAALLRIRAKKFAGRLRTERWAEPIPNEDIDWLKDEEIETYKQVLMAYDCYQRADFKWEAR